MSLKQTTKSSKASVDKPVTKLMEAPAKKALHKLTHEEIIAVQFPSVPHGIRPCGHQVLVMGQFIPRRTKSGIEMTKDSRRRSSYSIAVGKIEAFGPLAFRNKDTLELWKEKEWAKIGSTIFMPRSGSRITKTINGEEYVYALIDDIEVLAEITDLDGLTQFDF